MNRLLHRLFTAKQSVTPPMQARGTFARFTRRARRVLVYGQEEAHRLHHNYLGTEHLLLGLLREQEGVAGLALADLGIDLDSARAGVEAIVGRGDLPVSGRIGMTPRAKLVIARAVNEATRLHHAYVGTEHLLLALTYESRGVAPDVLRHAGIAPAQVREAVLRRLIQGPPQA
jgi:ATP-dependent Clp protease ATP-binding subunit ClpC